MTSHDTPAGFDLTGLSAEQALRLGQATGEMVNNARQQALREAYWKLREHASGYRGAEAFRRRIAAYEADHSDLLKARKALTHEFYARGIEAAARTVAEMLGVPEHEIEEGGTSGE